MVLVETDDEIVCANALAHLRNDAAVQSGLDEVGGLLRSNAVKFQIVETKLDVNLINELLPLDHGGHSRNALCGVSRLLRELAQLVQVVAVNLDRQRCVDAGKHMTDEMGQWLFDLDV